MKLGRAVAMLVAPLLMIGAGCYSVSVDSPAFRATKGRGIRPYRFRVEKADGPLVSAGIGTGFPSRGGRLSAESINRALAEIRPDLHGEEDAIPISIRVSGDAAPIMKSMDPLIPLSFLLCYTWADKDRKVTVKIYSGDGVTGKKGSCDATYTQRMGFFPFALLVPNRAERPTWRKVFGVGSAPDYGAISSRMAAEALGEAIDALTDGEIEELARNVPRTRTETVRGRLLEERTVETIHLAQDAEGISSPVVLTHQFREMERPVKSTHPTVLNQEYSSRTRLGVVVADVTEFAQDEADDWLLRRLIPKICETKALVIELEDLPPGDARFSVLSDETDGNHVRTIQFRQIQ